RVARANVIRLVFVLAHVSHDVGAGRNSLRLQRLDLCERGGTQLVWDDTQKVLLLWKLIHDCESIPRVAEHFDCSSIRAVLEFDGRPAVGLDAHFRRLGKNDDPAAIELDEGAVLKIGPSQDAVRESWIDRQRHREFCSSRSVLLYGEQSRGTYAHTRSVLI